MSETIKGLGVNWGVKGLTFTGFGTATGKPQSLTLQRGSQKAEVADEAGATVTQAFYDKRKTLSLNVIPTGTTIALAGAHLDLFMPEAGQTITVADSSNATVDGHFSGKYNLLTASLRKLNTGAASIDIELEQSEENDLTTVVS